MKKRVTSSDVAREAGVSRATVSYILNNTEGTRISEETRRKVLETAKRLSYHLDLNAQAMKTNRFMSIGVVSKRNITESRFKNVLSGIKEVLSKEKYSILLCSDEDDETGYPEYYRLYQNKKIDGIIFISLQEQLELENVEERAELMLKEQIPCVFIDYGLKNSMVNSVDINYFQGAYITARHLIEKGHKKIAFIVPDLDTQQESQRLQGITKAVEQEKDVELLIYRSGKTETDFTKCIVEVLKDKERYSALIVAWSAMAAETLYYTNKMKINVPEEFEVIALAEDYYANYTYPRLSCCELPLFEIGNKGGEILLENIPNTQLPVNLVLPCSLNLRDSG